MGVFIIVGALTGMIQGSKDNLAWIGIIVGAMFGFIVSNFLLILSIIFMTPRSEILQEATIQNIEENIVIDDVYVENMRGHKDVATPYAVDVLGTVDGQPVGFQILYDAEHDVMVPVQGLDNTLSIDFHEGSMVAKLRSDEQ